MGHGQVLFLLLVAVDGIIISLLDLYCSSFKKIHSKSGVVAQTCNPSTLELEAGDLKF